MKTDIFIDLENFDIHHNVPEDKPYFSLSDDPLIVSAISLLNKKGYRTNICCQGHLYPIKSSRDEGGIYEASEKIATCWIEFAPGTELPSLPSGFTLKSQSKGKLLLFKMMSRWRLDEQPASVLSDSEIEAEIIYTNQVLEDWVNSLPLVVELHPEFKSR